MTLHFIGMALVGELLMFFMRKFPPASTFAKKRKFTEELFYCNLCLGFWVYLFLSAIMRVNILDGFYYIPVFSELVTAAFTSFVMHIAVIGWKDEYTVMEIKG